MVLTHTEHTASTSTNYVTGDELYPVGTQPPLGQVPRWMHAWTIRQERFGQPMQSFRLEVVETPAVADDEVLVYVMAAGVNFNNVWAALGSPVDVIAMRQRSDPASEPFHIGGSDASGIVYRVGRNVTNLKVGDEVVVHCGQWDSDCPRVAGGGDPTLSPTFRIWGYETNWGSFAQFTKVQAHQCLPKPIRLGWAEAAAYMLVGATAFRMLHGWEGHLVRPGDVVLVWGGAGGVGSMAIQLARAAGARPVAVISSDDKADFCRRLGAVGCVNRRAFDHWGVLPPWDDTAAYGTWLRGARAFGKAIWDGLGERVNPRIVIEHPGQDTLPTSLFVCDQGGMVVTCAGTTGYNASLDLRYLWMRQKRFQGSHFANDEQAAMLNAMVAAGQIDPCLSHVVPFERLPDVHQMMHDNTHGCGNMAVLVGANA